jgi:hypothetical protein
MEEIGQQYDKSRKLIAIYLIGVIGALIVVGVESKTILRHIIQVIPIVIAMIFVLRQIKWSSFAALGIFFVWLIIMCCIWLHLLNITHVINGHFTVIEIILTILIGIFCLLGMLNSLRNALRQNWILLALMLILFMMLQFFSVWLSMRPSILYK